jgi:DNA-binding NarL/FixJ family response regulator
LSNDLPGAGTSQDHDGKAGGKMKVLIAEDSALVRERLTTLISEIKGIEWIIRAENASEALEVARNLKPDVVVLDIRMPDGNGIHVLKQIKQEPQAPIVIMLTAFPYAQYRQKCQEVGADYFFDKTSEFDRVAEVLEQLQSATPLA